MATVARYRSLLALGLLLVGSGLAQAQVPRLINFQGRLVNAAGEPLHGQYQITFGIWDDANLGQACFTETHPQVAVNSGLFSVNVGGATSGGIAAACTFAGPTFLELRVGTDDAMQPRLALTGAAYALAAERLDGLALGSFVQQAAGTGDVAVTGTLGVGTAAPSQRLEVSGNLNATGLCMGAACRVDWPTGTVTQISAGAGLTLTPNPIVTTGTVAVNPTYAQRRVATGCATGQAMRGVNEDGTPICITVPAATCQFQGRTYSTGAVCRNGNVITGNCSSGYLQFNQCTCGGDGSWSCYTASCTTIYPDAC